MHDGDVGAGCWVRSACPAGASEYVGIEYLSRRPISGLMSSGHGVEPVGATCQVRVIPGCTWSASA
ncbi:MAG: hypothetical protein ACRDQ4_25010 [Pseudonocardiaceae bacterium]